MEAGAQGYDDAARPRKRGAVIVCDQVELPARTSCSTNLQAGMFSRRAAFGHSEPESCAAFLLSGRASYAEVGKESSAESSAASAPDDFPDEEHPEGTGGV